MVTIKESLAEILKEEPKNFTESIDLAINLKEVDMSLPKNKIDAEVVLPKGRGIDVKVGIFATGDLALKAKNIADFVITPESMDTYFKNKRTSVKFINQVNFFLAETSLMPVIGKKLGIYLGPRNKMPKPIPPTLDPAPVVSTLKKTVKVRTKDKKTFHVPIGTVKMSVDDLNENYAAVMKLVTSKLENGVSNIRSVYVKKTMGKAHKVNLE
ncbi:MAG: 50S ribosomal protein L1 [Thermoplasmata archaeon]